MVARGDHSGSTAHYGLITPTHIVIANIGDSRGVLCSDGRVIEMSTDHKPDLVLCSWSPCMHSSALGLQPTEAARIQRAGGRVVSIGGCPRVNGDLAVRKNRLCSCGFEWWSSVLQLSRALGDFRFKASRLADVEQMVSPEAELKVWERTSKDEFLLMACDGIWDVMTSASAVSFLKEVANLYIYSICMHL